MKRTFSIAPILSVVGERLLGDFGDVQELCSFLTGDQLFTHQMLRAHEPCRQGLRAQFPEFGDYDDSEVNCDNWQEWLDVQVAKFGATREVEPLPEGMWSYKNPIVEAEELVGKNRVVVVKP